MGAARDERASGDWAGPADRQVITAVVLDENPDRRLDVGILPRDLAHHDREQASVDLRRDSVFSPRGQTGPFVLYLSVRGGRIVLDIRDEAHRPLCRHGLPLSRFRAIIKDYRFLLDAFDNAAAGRESARMQAIDMGRRALHDEGAGLMISLLAGQVRLDLATARRLFTLVCLLHG